MDVVVPEGWTVYDAADTDARNRGVEIFGARKYFAAPWDQWKETVGPPAQLAAQVEFIEGEFALLVAKADAPAVDSVPDTETVA